MKSSELTDLLQKALASARQLEKLAAEIAADQASAALLIPTLKGTLSDLEGCGTAGIVYDVKGSVQSQKICSQSDPYDCGAAGPAELYECNFFSCAGGQTGIDFGCDPNREFYCDDAGFACASFTCDAGHGYFCDDDNECTGTFACRSSTNTKCDGSTGNTYDMDGPSSEATSGDFQCAAYGEADFDCSGTFDCNAPSQFQCADADWPGQTGTFDCNQTASGFSCDASGTFECGPTNTGYTCHCEYST